MEWLTTCTRLCVGGYILSFIFLNLVAYLISAFYQRKFNQPSPRAGFVAAIMFSLTYIILAVVPVPTGAFLALLRILLLIGTTVASSWSSISLYYTMKRVRK